MPKKLVCKLHVFPLAYNRRHSWSWRVSTPGRELRPMHLGGTRWYVRRGDAIRIGRQAADRHFFRDGFIIVEIFEDA